MSLVTKHKELHVHAIVVRSARGRGVRPRHGKKAFACNIPPGMSWMTNHSERVLRRPWSCIFDEGYVFDLCPRALQDKQVKRGRIIKGFSTYKKMDTENA
ncbi:unnamed protein product, partial [Iphiclides podalirius]